MSGNIIPRLPVSKEGAVDFIAYEDILYIRVKEKETHILTHSETYICEESLRSLVERLGNSGFIKCHRNYMVNLNKIDKITHWNNGVYLLYFKEIEENIPVNRNYYKNLKKALQL